MTESITKTLGTGSGIDITQFVSDLVDAQYAVKTKTLTARADALKAQISSAAQLKSAMTGFSTALSALVGGGTLSVAATSSDASIFTAKALPGASIAATSATIKVRALATAQVANALVPIDKTLPAGAGTLKITLGTATVSGNAVTGFSPGAATPIDVTIAPGAQSLQDIVTAINAAKAGVTASIVTDASGSRLALKAATGAAQAFTIDATEDAANPGLARFEVGIGKTGTTIAQSGADAELDLDGIAIRRPTNSIKDLIEGVQIDLQSANLGKTVTLGTAHQTENLRQAVADVVSTYNELKGILTTETNAQTGSLRTDTAARQMVRALSALNSMPLVSGAPDGAPTTLSQLGVSTNRDGTLSVNDAQLTAALTKYPETVEKIFAAGSGATSGLASALKSISDTVTNSTYGLGASSARYTKLQTGIANDQQKATDSATKTRDRLTQQFAGMDSRVAAYKSTQSFIQQQVDMWTAKG